MLLYRRQARIVASIILLSVLAFHPVVAIAEDLPTPEPTPSAVVTPDPATPTPTPEPTPTPTPEPTPTPSPAPTPKPCPPTGNGIQSPTGAWSSTFAFNPDSCLWESAHFSWDPVTKQYSPKETYPLVYNATTDSWDSQAWHYSAAKGIYILDKTTTKRPVLAPIPVAGTSIDSPSEMMTVTPAIQPKSLAASASSTGDNSNNSVNANDSLSLGISDTTVGSIINFLNSYSGSGGVSILGNTTAGSALSGDSTTIANIMNLLQSSTNPSIATFVANVDGDVYGDLYVNPSQIAGNVAVNDNQQQAVDLNVANDGSIINNVKVAATSGDATVDSNTTAGNATTGDATAIVNLMNLINSAIGSGQSFIGTININGSLNGDILLPNNMLNSVIADSGPDSNIDVNRNNSTTLNANLTNNDNIANNVNADAQSGNASVDGNTTAGTAHSGTASTNVTLLNLTGHQVIGKDALLVFVNVLGKWVGLIMNAPSGSTAAALGGNVIDNRNVDTNLNANVTNNAAITNNVDAGAYSGDALVSNNTTAGNARSGNAKVGVNVLNMTNSQFALSDWFGILFINVLGSWYGSFGVNTAAGNPIVAPATTATTGSTPTFSFVPKPATIPGNNQTIYSDFGANTESNEGFAAVLAASHNSGDNITTVASSLNPAAQKGRGLPVLPMIGGGISATLFGIERLLTIREKRKKSV